MSRTGSLFIVLTVTATLALAQGAADTATADIAGAPRSDDGRFTNKAKDTGTAAVGVRLQFMLRRMATYFRSGRAAPERIDNDGAWLRANARTSQPSVTWVGHATLLVQFNGVTFLTDPT